MLCLLVIKQNAARSYYLKCGPVRNGQKIGYVDMDGQRPLIQSETISLADTVLTLAKKTC